MKAIERLYQYFEFKNIKPTRFEKENGMSNGYFGVQLKRKADIGSSILEKIVDSCRDLNITWLLTGHGEMLKGTIEDIHPDKTSNENSRELELLKKLTESNELLIKSQKNEIKYLKKELEDFKSKFKSRKNPSDPPIKSKLKCPQSPQSPDYQQI